MISLNTFKYSFAGGVGSISLVCWKSLWYTETWWVIHCCPFAKATCQDTCRTTLSLIWFPWGCIIQEIGLKQKTAHCCSHAELRTWSEFSFKMKLISEGACFYLSVIPIRLDPLTQLNNIRKGWRPQSPEQISVELASEWITGTQVLCFYRRWGWRSSSDDRWLPQPTSAHQLTCTTGWLVHTQLWASHGGLAMWSKNIRGNRSRNMKSKE